MSYEKQNSLSHFIMTTAQLRYMMMIIIIGETSDNNKRWWMDIYATRLLYCYPLTRTSDTYREGVALLSIPPPQNKNKKQIENSEKKKKGNLIYTRWWWAARDTFFLFLWYHHRCAPVEICIYIIIVE